MNALLICSAGEDGRTPALIERLCVGHDLTIAVDGGADLCLEAGVTPDLLVGDLDSATPLAVDRLASLGVPVTRFPSEKDATDLELAIVEARRLGATAITVTAVSGGRLDHGMGALAALAGAADMSPRIIEPGMTAWVLDGRGERGVRLKGRGATVSIIAWGGVALVSASGLRWPLSRAELGPETARGISNLIAGDDRAEVQVHQGTVIVMSPETSVPAAVFSASRG
ncbi:MAG: thiamine diphosphokinase [Coriobacteriia bacterium]|nr:thiamine diphosphokinase [Coriobacteriia bacterium]